MSSRNGLGTLPRRRNGKQQACEPCRKAKIACDHSLPVCDRCKRRKVASKCVYLAAPMTRPASEGNRRESETTRLNFPPTPKTTSSTITSPRASIQTESSVRPNPESGPFVRSGGFFGPTNFADIYLQNRENLGNEDIQISIDSRDPYVTPYEGLQSQTFLMLASNELRGSPRVALGVKILRSLPDQATCNFLMEWYFENSHECVLDKHSMMAIVNSLWTTYGKFLKEPRRADDLENMSSVLCKNAEKPLEEFEDYEPWIASITGTKLRWEILGGVFACLTSATLSLPERDAFFSTQRDGRKDRKYFAVELKDCVQACITLSNYMDLLNLPMVALLAKNLILQTVISGDTSLVVWRELGDLVSASTALGLHRQVDDGQRVTFISQAKKRLFTVIFNIDKGSSLLCGRPPALSYRYTKFKLPLDISEEAVMRGGAELQRAIQALDADGWNTEGQLYTATTTRAHGLLSIVLNEVLELSLGDAMDCTSDRTRYLIDRLQQSYDSFPSSLKFHSGDPSSTSITDHVLWKRICLRLQLLEYRLVVERLAYKQGDLDGQSMVDCAREMLELTVLLWVQRDRFVEHHHDYDWMLMCWGVPSSGVLCVELLKQMKLASGTLQIPRLPRSEIVQNLSLLIGFLEWVRPAAGNYQLCARMRQIIKRILDQILNPPPMSSAPPASQESAQSEGGQGFDGDVPFDPSVFGTYDGLDNLDWLNSVDWSRGPWIELGGQDFSAARWN